MHNTLKAYVRVANQADLTYDLHLMSRIHPKFPTKISVHVFAGQHRLICCAPLLGNSLKQSPSLFLAIARSRFLTS